MLVKYLNIPIAEFGLSRNLKKCFGTGIRSESVKATDVG